MREPIRGSTQLSLPSTVRPRVHVELGAHVGEAKAGLGRDDQAQRRDPRTTRRTATRPGGRRATIASCPLSLVTSILMSPTLLSGETRANRPLKPMPKRPFSTSTASIAPNDRSFRTSWTGTSTSDLMPPTVALPSIEVAHRYGATVTVHRSPGGAAVAPGC